MRIATWNVNGMRARLDFVLHWLRDRRPDLVGLQELKLRDEEFPHLALEELGYRATTHGQKAWNGVAVLSQEPVETIQQGLPGQESLGARLLTVDAGELDFCTVYVPNGKHVNHDDFARKLDWLDDLIAYVAGGRDRERPLVLGGDFNVVPAAIDSWNEEVLEGQIFHTEAERDRMAALREQELVDLFRQRHPEERMFSWWDYRAGAFHRNRGLRIDLLLGSPAVLDRVDDVWIDRDYRKKKEGLTASDHAPVIADLDGR